MTDTQIFVFLAMPFLFGLTSSTVLVSRERTKREQPADQPEPVIRPNAYRRKPRSAEV